MRAGVVGLGLALASGCSTTDPTPTPTPVEAPAETPASSSTADPRLVVLGVEIPHPFVVETLEALADLPVSERAKVQLIHLNHTNPLLDGGDAVDAVEDAGLRVAHEGQRVGL